MNTIPEKWHDKNIPITFEVVSDKEFRGSKCNFIIKQETSLLGNKIFRLFIQENDIGDYDTLTAAIKGANEAYQYREENPMYLTNDRRNYLR